MKVKVVSQVNKGCAVACIVAEGTLYIKGHKGNDCFAMYSDYWLSPVYYKAGVWEGRLSEATKVFYSGDVIQITF